MRRHLRILLTVGALGLVLPVCAAEPSPPRSIAPPKRIPETIDVPPTPAGEPVSTAAIPRDVRRAVVADAAQRLGVPESSVVLTNAEQLTWNDGSLGCPQPGRSYPQVLVPGYRVVARTKGGEITYHTDTRGTAVACGVTSTKPAKKLSDKVGRGAEPVTAPPELRPVR
jgi:hypothetical protein